MREVEANAGNCCGRVIPNAGKAAYLLDHCWKTTRIAHEPCGLLQIPCAVIIAKTSPVREQLWFWWGSVGFHAEMEAKTLAKANARNVEHER